MYHICVIKKYFDSYTLIRLDETMFIGNFGTIEIECYGRVLLKRKCNKVLHLCNVRI